MDPAMAVTDLVRTGTAAMDLVVGTAVTDTGTVDTVIQAMDGAGKDMAPPDILKVAVRTIGLIRRINTSRFGLCSGINLRDGSVRCLAESCQATGRKTIVRRQADSDFHANWYCLP